MAKELGVPATQYSYFDSVILMAAQKGGEPYGSCLIESQKLKEILVGLNEKQINQVLFFSVYFPLIFFSIFILFIYFFF